MIRSRRLGAHPFPVLGWFARRRRASRSPDQVVQLIHADLPRAGPGSTETTRQLLRLTGELPARPFVVAIGAGPASLVLAAETRGLVLATHPDRPVLARLQAAAAAAGLSDRVHPVRASMRALPLPGASVDLLWAEGSACTTGVDAALAAWRPLLAPGGALVLTETGWTTPHPAREARRFWAEAHPGMRTSEGTIRAVQGAGWSVQASYLLPDSDWACYHRALAERVDQLREQGVDRRLLQAAAGWEIDIRRRHGADYGCTGYVLRPR